MQVGSTSEHCLDLKIARPAQIPVSQKLPVMLYLYGGDFQVGADSTLLSDPTRLVMQLVSDSILISYVDINYRGGSKLRLSFILNSLSSLTPSLIVSTAVYGFAANQAFYDANSLNVCLRDRRLALV